MDNKIRKGARNKVLSIVLCLSLVLGMSIVKTVSAGSVTDTSLGAYDANLSTNDYIGENAIAYNAGETYVIGSLQMGSGINYVSGTALNILFDREIGLKDDDKNSAGEYVEFLPGSVTALKKDYTVNFVAEGDTKSPDFGLPIGFAKTGTEVIDGTTFQKYGMYVSTDKYCKNGTIATAVQAPANATPFVMVLHNLKSDLRIRYEQQAGKMSYSSGTDYTNVKAFDGATAHFTASETKIEIEKPTLTFDVTDGAPAGYTFDTVSPVKGLTAGNTMPADKIPAAPSMKTGVDDLNFKGWYTNATGDLADANKLTSTTKITQNTTYYARWETKKITLAWNADSLKTLFPLGGKAASAEKIDAGLNCGGKLHFTLTIDGKAYNTANTLSAADQAIVDKVTFTFTYSEKFQGLVGETYGNETYRVVDMQAGGLAIARYSGIVRVRLNYLGKYQSAANSDAVVIVPGDMDGDGTIQMSDLNMQYDLEEGRLKTGAVGTYDEYLEELTDTNADGAVIFSDVSDSSQKVMKQKNPTDYVTYNTAFYPSV